MAKKKLESNFINMVFVLAAITAVSASLLGFVYGKTKPLIDKQNELKKLSAIQDVLKEGFDNRPDQDEFKLKTDDGAELDAYPAKIGESLDSIAIKTFTKSAFSGEMWLMVGFLEDGTINKIKVLEQKETPGLGTKIVEPAFKNQYFGKHPEQFNIKVKKDGGEIDAITAATITSRAYSEAVERAYKAFMNYKNNK